MEKESRSSGPDAAETFPKLGKVEVEYPREESNT
jgi:hypothetical protein